jgi:hypothetical protein
MALLGSGIRRVRTLANGRGESLYVVMVNRVETTRVEMFACLCLRATRFFSSQRCSFIIRDEAVERIGCGGLRHYIRKSISVRCAGSLVSGGPPLRVDRIDYSLNTRC